MLSQRLSGLSQVFAPSSVTAVAARPPAMHRRKAISKRGLSSALVVAVISSVLTISPAHAKPSDTSILAPATVKAGETFVLRTYWMVGTRGRNCLVPDYDFGGASAYSSMFGTTRCEWSSNRPSKRFKKMMDARKFTYRDPGVYTISVEAGLVDAKTGEPLPLTNKRLRGPHKITHTITVTEQDLTPPTGLPSNWRKQMLEAVNYERDLAGVAPVKMCENLQKAAQRFANYQAEENFYSHKGPDGSTPGSRAQAAGYSGWRSVGENIYKSPDTVSEAMAGWVASPGHYENLTSSSYTHVGLGFAENPDTGKYWVQNFGAGGQCNGK